MTQYRIGQGFDVHALVPNRPLVLCGVTIPAERGLLGHSDADVAVHALMDAMLGALALGDIGKFFPDNDPQYKNIQSLILLDKVTEAIHAEGFAIENLDITLILQAPKIAPHILQMRETLASRLSLPMNAVSVKATTTEKLGFTGRGEGVAAQAVVLLCSLGNGE